MAERAGRKVPELEQPEIPNQVRYLERWYCDLKLSNAPLSWLEIKAWSEMKNIKPNDWEIATLIAIDKVISHD